MTFLSPQYNSRLGYTAQQDRLFVGDSFQNGVFGSGDLLVSAGSGFNSQIATGSGAIAGTVQTKAGRYRVTNIGAVTALHNTPDGSLSRLDTLYLKVYDSIDGGDSSDVVQPLVVTGTPQSGNPNAATLLASRAGIGAVPTNAMLIGDVYVPAAAANAAAFTYRDRRPFARGAHWIGHGSANGSDYNTTSNTPAAIDSGNLQQRLECSGAPVKFTFDFHHAANLASGAVTGGLDILMDGAQLDGHFWTIPTPPVTLVQYARSIVYVSTSIPAGSHLFTWRFWMPSGTTFYIQNTVAGQVATWEIQEDLRVSAGNGAS